MKVLGVKLTVTGNSNDMFRNLYHLSALLSFVLEAIPNKTMKKTASLNLHFTSVTTFTKKTT